MNRAPTTTKFISNPATVGMSAADARRYGVNNALASSSIEGFIPTSEHKLQLERYISGATTADQLIEEIKAHYAMYASSARG